MSNNFLFVFDLDDTLYKEIDFLKSAYREISFLVDRENSESIYEEMIVDYYSKENVFLNLTLKYKDYTINDLLNIYRLHKPKIRLDKDVATALEYLRVKGKTGLITDGRSITQRNKLTALGIDKYFDDILISEEIGYSKPDVRLFEYFHKYKSDSNFYIANDTNKDFLAPNQLGWETVCLLDHENVNINKQNFDLEEMYLPKHRIFKLSELKDFI